jgi:hypothetical protein
MSTQTKQPPKPLQADTIEARLIKEQIWNRLWRDNEHFMATIVGREGSGKSHTGIKLAEVVDPTFNAKRIMFDPVDFLKRLKEWKANDETQGKMIVIDEAGVGVGVRSWYEKDQIMLNQVLQIIRDENMGVIFTLPRLTELDSQTRGRLHAYLEMMEKSPGNWANVKWLDWDPTRDERDKIYREYPTLTINGNKRVIKRLKLSPPSDEVIEPYEARKDEFQRQQYDKAIDEMEEDVDDEMSVKEVAMEIADSDMSQFVSRHGQTNQPYINKQLIRAEYDLSHADAQGVKALLDRQFSKEDIEEYA